MAVAGAMKPELVAALPQAAEGLDHVPEQDEKMHLQDAGAQNVAVRTQAAFSGWD